MATPNRPLTFPLTGALSRPIGTFGRWPAGGAAPFDPASLFASGEAGYAIAADDFSKLFQNSAGTTAVTGTTQPVGYVADLSGNGNHFKQPTDSYRLTLLQDSDGKYYLDASGIDQSVRTDSSVTVPASVRKATIWLAYVVEGDISLNDQLLLAAGHSGTTGGLGFFARSTSNNYTAVRMSQGLDAITAQAFNTKFIISVQLNNNTQGASKIALRVNGVSAPTSSINSNVIGDFVSIQHRLFAFSDTAAETNGRLYGAVVRYAESTAEEIEAVEAWLADKAGVTL